MGGSILSIILYIVDLKNKTKQNKKEKKKLLHVEGKYDQYLLSKNKYLPQWHSNILNNVWNRLKVACKI